MKLVKESILKGRSKEEISKDIKGRIIFEEISNRYGIISGISINDKETYIDILFLYDGSRNMYIEKVESMGKSYFDMYIEFAEEKLKKLCDLYDFLKNYPTKN